MLPTTFQSELIEAGCDEAGRGCLAGPLFAAAVILPPEFDHPMLNDSKKLSRKQRDLLRPIIEREALAWAVAEVSPQRVDEVNVLNASFEAMNIAIKKLATTPQMLLIDGNMFRTTLAIEYRCIVGGDGKFGNIAAASVLAKTHRDERMDALDGEFPEYGWAKNMGYPTAAHREAIARFGVTKYHRLTFKLRSQEV